MLRQELFRQALVLFSMGCGIIVEGYIFGHTSTMVAGLYEEKEQLHYTDDEISWIVSVMYPSTVFGTMIASLITEKFGRRLTITIFTIPLIMYWIVLYYIKDKYLFVFMRIMVGLCFGATVPIIFMATAEYSSPKMRGTYLSIITNVGPVIGGTAGQFLGLGLDWRTAAMAAATPTVLAATLPLLCVESPSWLASRGKFEKCAEAFRALHGHTASSERELQILLQVEKRKFKQTEKKTKAITLLMERLKVAATKRYFWNVVLLTVVTQIYKAICGKFLGGVLGVVMLQHMSGQSDVLVYSIGVNAAMILGCVASTLLSSKMHIRTILFAGGIINNVALIVLSIMLYVGSISEISFPWVNVILYSINNFIVNASVYPILEMLPSEIYPLEIKSACISIQGFVTSVITFAYIKVIPSLFVEIEYYGVFLLHVIATSICMVYLWIKLPETKGKTLQEIELKLKNEQLDVEVLLTEEQMKELVDEPNCLDDLKKNNIGVDKII